MGKSPLILAALASDAVPGLVIKKATALSGDGTGNFDAAVITDEAGEHYIVRMPNSPAAGTELELELKVIKSLSSFGARLGFEVPKPIGETRDSVGNRVMIFKFVYGTKVDATRVAPASNLSLSISRAIAGIHSLPLELVQSAGLPEFSPAENIRARVAELDRAAQTGKVPAVLLSRWEQALEDVSLFRYQPTVIHGALSGDAMLEQDHSISGVIDWKNLQINDPALDFAWLIPASDHELLDAVLLNYQLARSGSDSNIALRATLYSELELAKWLLHGYTRRDAAVVADAVQMLQDLAEQANAGELIPLTQSQAPQPPVTAFVADAPEVEEIETVTVVSSSWSLDESVDEVDDSTKPIPTQADQDRRDDLF
jgi:aminoglycoside phosphotransferase (APT) family kinase protein